MEIYDRHNPLFEKRIRIVIRKRNVDDQILIAMMRVLTGCQQSDSTRTQKTQLLYAEITNDESKINTLPFFLYVWKISEIEFHQLRHDERLLVDFQGFADNFITLLECCTTKQYEREIITNSSSIYMESTLPTAKLSTSTSTFSSPNDKNTHRRPAVQQPESYYVVLDLRNESETNNEKCRFEVVEKNPFRQLTHLALEFRRADNTIIKSYLTARLIQILEIKKKIEYELSSCRTRLETTMNNEEKLKETLKENENEKKQVVKQLQLQHSEEICKQKEEHMNDLRLVEEQYEKRLDELVKQKNIIQETLKMKEEQLLKQTTETTKKEHELELQISKMSAELQQLHVFENRCKTEMEELQSNNKKLENQQINNARLIAQYEAELSALRDQNKIHEKNLVQTETTLENCRLKNNELEQSHQICKGNLETMRKKLGDMVVEIKKGNDIIQKLQQENYERQNKIKGKNITIQKQESTIISKQRDIDNLKIALRKIENELKSREEKIETLKENIEEMKIKLDQGNKLLEDNQNVIAYLNEEINDKSLSFGIPERSRKQAHTQKTKNPLIFQPNMMDDASWGIGVDVSPESILSAVR